MGLSFIDDRIKSAWDVEAFIGVNLLGIIPDLSGHQKGDDKYIRFVLDATRPELLDAVEAFPRRLQRGEDQFEAGLPQGRFS